MKLKCDKIVLLQVEGAVSIQAKELKEYIIQDNERLYSILRATGFHNIWQASDSEVRCATPDGDNETSVMIRLNEDLYTSMFSVGYSGDLFGAIQKVQNTSFADTMVLIHNILGLATNGKKINYVVDPLSQLKNLAMGGFDNRPKENRKYTDAELGTFVQLPHKSLIEEGVSPKVAKQFNVCFDPRKNRIIFPHYDWIDTDKIVGIKGRTTQTQDEIDMTGTPKYWNYISGYRKTLNMYGYNVAKEYIPERSKIILFEGEKSVLKEFTFNRGKGCSVALGGHSISEEQVNFILKNIPLDCEVVLAFDKDVMTKEEEGESFIIDEAQKFRPFREVSYIYDKYDLLGKKDSPIDKGYKVWSYLMKYRKGVK